MPSEGAEYDIVDVNISVSNDLERVGSRSPVDRGQTCEFSMTVELTPDLERFLNMDTNPMPDEWQEKHR